MLLTSGEERGAAPGDWEIPGVAPAVGGAGVGSRRRAGPTWAPGCASLALHSRGGSGPGLWLALYLPLNLAAMEGPQELLSGKLQLCFTPAARTSLLLLRLLHGGCEHLSSTARMFGIDGMNRVLNILCFQYLDVY